MACCFYFRVEVSWVILATSTHVHIGEFAQWVRQLVESNAAVFVVH